MLEQRLTLRSTKKHIAILREQVISSHPYNRWCYVTAQQSTKVHPATQPTSVPSLQSEQE